MLLLNVTDEESRESSPNKSRPASLAFDEKSLPIIKDIGDGKKKSRNGNGIYRQSDFDDPKKDFTNGHLVAETVLSVNLNPGAFLPSGQVTPSTGKHCCRQRAKHRGTRNDCRLLVAHLQIEV